MVAAMCGLFVLKCLLYILNTMLTIMAIVIVAIGAGVLYVLNQMDDAKGTDFQIDFTHLTTAGILVIIVGVLVILFVFCGCCGAFLGAGWMLIWFAIIMGCLLIVECVVIGFSWKYTEQSQLEQLIGRTFQSLLNTAERAKEKGRGVDDAIQAVLDVLQNKMECCGDRGQSDYTDRNLDYRNYCSNKEGGYYDVGCTSVVSSFFMKNGHTIGGVVVATMAIQLICICLAIFLYFTIA